MLYGLTDLWAELTSGALCIRGVGFRTAGTGTWRSSAERVVLDPPSFGEPYRDSRGDLNLKAEGGAIKTSPRMLKRPHTVMGVSRISRSADRSTRSERTGEKPDDDRSATLELDAEDDNGDGIDNDEGTDDDDQDGASDMIGEEEVAQAGRRTSERVEEQNLLKKGDNVSKEVPTPSSYRSPAKNRSSSSQRRPWTSPAVSSQIATAALKSPSSPARPNQRTSSLQEPSAILGRTCKAPWSASCVCNSLFCLLTTSLSFPGSPPRNARGFGPPSGAPPRALAADQRGLSGDAQADSFPSAVPQRRIWIPVSPPI